jgi:hypothetical protein
MLPWVNKDLLDTPLLAVVDVLEPGNICMLITMSLAALFTRERKR